jgi:hypothetical protein
MKVHSLVIVFLLAALGLVAPAQALTYDLAIDYSLTNGNPNGAWTYGYCDGNTALNVGFTQLENTGSIWGAIEGWCLTAGWGDPNVSHNITGDDYAAYGYHWANNGIGLGAGGGLNPVVMWTCLEAGTYDVAATFTGNLESEGTSLFLVSLNLSDSWLNSVTHDWGYGQSETYNGQLTLSAGDTVSFVNAAWSNGGQYVGLAATITQVPEPGTLALLAFGLFGATLYMRRSR